MAIIQCVGLHEHLLAYVTLIALNFHVRQVMPNSRWNAHPGRAQQSQVMASPAAYCTRRSRQEMKRQNGADLSVDLLAGAPWLCTHERGYGSCLQQ